MQGAFLWSLVATDVCSGWTEAVPLLAREQSLVVEGLEVIRRQFPVPILGIDSDNDSAFINETLLAYCQEQQLEFTRSRAYQKNDQAWIEQKNGAVVRRFVGYERFSGMVAGQCLAQLFQAVRLFVNHFQPSFKFRSKTREGAKVKKTYHKPATPCERLLAHASVAEAAKERLRPKGAGWTRWSCCTASGRLKRLWPRWGRGSRAAGRGGRVWSSSWRSCPSCGGRGSSADASGRGSPAPLLADAEGSLRGRVAGNPLVASGRSGSDGQVVVGAVASGIPGAVPGGTAADVAAPHPGVASGDGPRVGVRMPGGEASG